MTSRAEAIAAAVDAYILMERKAAAHDKMLGELALLREVHESARQFLRLRGIDKERPAAALVRLVNATEAVKDFDGQGGGA